MIGWFKRRIQARAERKQIDGLIDRLHVAPEDRDVATIFPIILPGELIRDDWPGPIIALEEVPFALSWAEIAEPGRWVYVDHELARYWEDKAIDWRRAAFANLRRVSNPGVNGEKCNDDGQPFVKVMFQPDAFGPSRLLIPRLLESELGADYRVALPERTCAVAFKRELTPTQEQDVQGIVDGCFRNGTEPMSPQRFVASDFWHLATENGW